MDCDRCDNPSNWWIERNTKGEPTVDQGKYCSECAIEKIEEHS